AHAGGSWRGGREHTTGSPHFREMAAHFQRPGRASLAGRSICQGASDAVYQQQRRERATAVLSTVSPPSVLAVTGDVQPAMPGLRSSRPDSYSAQSLPTANSL